MKKVDMKLRDDCSLPMIPLDINTPEGIDGLLSERAVKGVNPKGEECLGTIIFITAHPNWVRKNWETIRSSPTRTIEEE